jgi:hypothetical protein
LGDILLQREQNDPLQIREDEKRGKTTLSEMREENREDQSNRIQKQRTEIVESEREVVESKREEKLTQKERLNSKEKRG